MLNAPKKLQCCFGLDGRKSVKDFQDTQLREAEEVLSAARSDAQNHAVTAVPVNHGTEVTAFLH
jgi:hypothetical protein